MRRNPPLKEKEKEKRRRKRKEKLKEKKKEKEKEKDSTGRHMVGSSYHSSCLSARTFR